jgi:hypothetical protein
VNCEVVVAVDAGDESYQRGHDNRQSRITAAGPNNPDDYSFNHIAVDIVLGPYPGLGRFASGG